MQLPYRDLRARLGRGGLWPTSRVALVACYLLGLDLLLFGLQKFMVLVRLSAGQYLGGWVSFLSFIVTVLFLVLAFRWLKKRLLWRLRNRLIVTYVFIGVIPVVMLVALGVGSAYLFGGQFATYIVTTALNSELQSLDAANAAIAHQLAASIQHGAGSQAAAIASLQKADKDWADRQICVWLDQRLILDNSPAGVTPTLPSRLGNSFREVVRDHDKLFLRALDTVPVSAGTLSVLSSEPLDQRLLQQLAANLGQITLYEGLKLQSFSQPSSQARGTVTSPGTSSPEATSSSNSIVLESGKGQRVVLDTSKATPTFTAGTVPPPTQRFDSPVPFGTSVSVVDWNTGDRSNPAAIIVQTRVSKLYERLFAAQGDFAPTAEFALLVAFIIFAVVEVTALIIGTRLTRTVTGAVAELYAGTQQVNRGDFGHRIPVKSSDQIATLASSFNSMTASLEKLMEEQKEKQRLENELVIAQEVQAQLFPRQISQLASLEVHGFCRPARTVSGDYYDFLALDSERLLLAVGDISGKGISAALLMATIHSAVRAYSLENIPVLRETVAVGGSASSDRISSPGLPGAEISPGVLLSLLNHQLYESTPTEKYATLFLGIYNGAEQRLTYSNGGHLAPIVMSEDGSFRRLEAGGMVVGLFDQQTYDESSVQLRPGEMFLAYSDGVTEPENDFGEFSEQRLIDLLRENRDLPLPRISEIVTAAVDDWIGANEQPDDITLVLARAR